jgi:hypothetical protein
MAPALLFTHTHCLPSAANLRERGHHPILQRGNRGSQSLGHVLEAPSSETAQTCHLLGQEYEDLAG